jgi:iron complex transport system permease protein
LRPLGTPNSASASHLTAAPRPRRDSGGGLLERRSGRAGGLLGAALVLALCAVASLAIGSRPVPFDEVVRSFTAYDGSDAHAIVRDLRVPRTALGLLVGASLGVAGALMQGVTRNPLAEPGILGINAGAAFAVVLAISVLGVSAVSSYAAFALAGAAATAALLFALGATGRGGATPVRLAIAGAVLSSLLMSVTSAVLVFDAQTLDQFRFWVVGSIAGRDARVTVEVLPFLGAGLLLALAAARGLNALALGDDVARSLGQYVGRARLLAGVAVVLLAGGTVAAAGPVGFVGLAVPHIARAVAGADHRWLVPYSAVLGAALLLGADVLGRVIARPAEVQVGIVTVLLGAPFFLWLIRRGTAAAL